MTRPDDEERIVPSLSRTSAVLLLTTCLGLGGAACAGDSSSQAGVPAEPLAKIDALTGQRTAVRLDPAFVQAVSRLGVAPGVIGAATFDAKARTVAFRITGGNLTYFDPRSGIDPYVQGRIEHFQSGLTLTRGSTVVALRNFVVDPGRSLLIGKVLVNGTPYPDADTEVPLLFLDGRTLDPLEVDDAGTGVLAGTTVSLTRTAAEALNMVFMTEALKEFFPVGVAQITVDVPQD